MRGVLDLLEVPAVPWVQTSLLRGVHELPGGIVAAPRWDPLAWDEGVSGGWVRVLCLATAWAARVAAVAGRSGVDARAPQACTRLAVCSLAVEVQGRCALPCRWQVGY